MKQILDALGTVKIRNHGINLTVPVRIDSATLGADMGRVAVQINGEGSILAASTVQHTVQQLQFVQAKGRVP